MSCAVSMWAWNKTVISNGNLFLGYGDNRDAWSRSLHSLPKKIRQYHLRSTSDRSLSWCRAGLAAAGNQRLCHEPQISELWSVEPVQEHERFLRQLRLRRVHLRIIFRSNQIWIPNIFVKDCWRTPFLEFCGWLNNSDLSVDSLLTTCAYW